MRAGASSYMPATFQCWYIRDGRRIKCEHYHVSLNQDPTFCFIPLKELETMGSTISQMWPPAPGFTEENVSDQRGKVKYPFRPD